MFNSFYMPGGVPRGFLGGSVVKNSHTKEDSIFGLRRSLEKEMATHSSILAWEGGAWQATVYGVTKGSDTT